MADDKTTTTTTTEAPTSTTTTTEAPVTTDTTTVTSAPAVQPEVEKQGELAVDKDADAHVLKEQSEDERLAQARADGLANHAAEHAHDEDTNHGDVTSRDKEVE